MLRQLLLLSQLLLASLLPFGICTVYAITDTDTIPDPVYATWIVMPQSPSPTSGLPAARCDHSLHSLTGRALRPNTIHIQSTSSTSTGTTSQSQLNHDPFANKLWLYGGHQNAGFTDTWLLDVGVSPAQWELLSYTPTSGLPIQGRWGTGISFVPNGFDAADTGLTAIIYGGYSDTQYLGDVATFNFGNGVFRELVSGGTSMSSTAPFPRGYVELIALPKGSGNGATSDIDTNTDSGTFFTHGGLGASDGVQFSASDKDWGDEWLLDLTHIQSSGSGKSPWSQVGSTNCLRNVTTCTDSLQLANLITQFTNTSASSYDPVNVTASLRPADVYSAMQTIASAINSQNLQPNTYSNLPGACTTSCVEFASQTSELQPPKSEGYRLSVVGTNLYMFGGYACSEHGQQSKGGFDCFYNSMFILNLASMTWREIQQPNSDSPWFKYHPSRRAYHTMTAVPGRNLLIIEGGAYQESGGTLFFYNDAYAFDLSLEKFVPFQTLGIPPLVHWSAAAAAEGDKVYVIGGCQNAIYLSDLMVLQVGLRVSADNCYASGAGLSIATAGTQSSFYIQTREFERMRISNDTNATQIIWGNNATYGSGLSFTVQLVSVGDSSSLSLVQGKVIELGLGLYQVTYTATAGSAYQLFVSYSSFDEPHPIPGSPFSLKLEPKAEAEPDQSTVVGYGARITVQGQRATFAMQMRDGYGNPFTDDSFLLQQQQPTVVSSKIAIAVPQSQHKSGNVLGNLTTSGAIAWTSILGTPLLINANLGETPESASASTDAAPSLSVVNTRDGLFSISYDAPTGLSDFYLSVTVNGIPVSGSPFHVMSLSPLVLSRGSVIAFRCLASFCIFLCLLSALCVFRYRAEPIMRSSSPNFLYLLITGSCVSSLSVVFLTIEGSDQACQAFHSMLSIGFVTSLTSLLVKSYRVSIIFNAKQLKVATNLRDSRLLIPTAAVILLMTLLNIIWIGVDPMRSVSHPADNEYSDVLSYQSCSGVNSDRWSGSLLGFCGVLLLYGVYLAVQTGQVPENYNESKVIAASVYNAFFCCIVVVPLMFFLNTSQFLQGRLVILSLAILWCSLFNVLALILPKALVFAQILTLSDSSKANVIVEVGANGIATSRNASRNNSRTGTGVDSFHTRRASARGSLVISAIAPRPTHTHTAGGSVARVHVTLPGSLAPSRAPSPSNNQLGGLDPHHLNVNQARPTSSSVSARRNSFQGVKNTGHGGKVLTATHARGNSVPGTSRRASEDPHIRVVDLTADSLITPDGCDSNAQGLAGDSQSPNVTMHTND